MIIVAEFGGTDLSFHFAPKKSEERKGKEKEEVKEQFEMDSVRTQKGDSLYSIKTDYFKSHFSGGEEDEVSEENV